MRFVFEQRHFFSALMNSSSGLIPQLLTSIAASADSFVKVYYQALDQRSESFRSLFSQNAKIVWNGNTFDSTAYQNFIAALPHCNHSIHSYDAHSLNNDIVILISGAVSYSGAKERTFSETVVLHGENGTFVIEGVCLRFV